MDKNEIIKEIRKLRRSVKCGNFQGHQPGCSCHIYENTQYNTGLEDCIEIIKRFIK